MTKDIQSVVTQLVTEICIKRGLKDKPTSETSLVKSDIIDSLGLITFAAKLEEVFGITISVPDMHLKNFENIELICEFVRSKLSNV